MSLVGSLISGVGSIAGGLIGASASKSAASTQSDAANYAADLQNQQFKQTQQNLQPYMGLGEQAINPLVNALGYNYSPQTGMIKDPNSPLNQTFSYGAFSAPTEAQAQATPGYQFTLNQGLKSTQNSAAARGLGSSGAALKGASAYSTGLADSTYNDVYNRALNAYNANYNTASGTFQTNYNAAAGNASRLGNVVSGGQSAAAGLGGIGAQTAQSIGNTVQSGAASSAAGTVGSANALTSALQGAGNSALLYGLTQNNAGGTGGTTSGSNSYGFTI
jgi:hypothetical protein